MQFEEGKIYDFTKKEFEVSRESGRLVFLVEETATGVTHKIKPFNFQNTSLPETLQCVYNGGKLEQTRASIYPLIYTIGEEYQFRVLKQMNNSMVLTLVDDANGITFGKVDLGPRRFERFQTIYCEVTGFNGEDLKLKYNPRNEKKADFFDLNHLNSIPAAKLLTRAGIVRKILVNPIFSEAKARFDSRDSSWVISALGEIIRRIPRWIASDDSNRHRFHSRLRTLMRLRDMATGIVEESDFMAFLEPSKAGPLRSAIFGQINSIEDYIETLRLITAHQEENVIRRTLNSLRNSGWLYLPERKMRIIIAIFNIFPQLSHKYVGDIFEVVKKHHNEPHFTKIYLDSFLVMLREYIENESKSLNPVDTESLLELAEAIAIELLLAEGRELPEYARHRAVLYAIAAIISGQPNPPAAVKALETALLVADHHLEFGWSDLNSMRMMLSHLNTTPHAHAWGGPSPAPDMTVFEGETALLRATKGKMLLANAESGDKPSKKILMQVYPELSVGVRLAARLLEQASLSEVDLSRHHRMWREIEQTMLEKQNQGASRAGQLVSMPHIGDKVDIMIYGVESDSRYNFKFRTHGAPYEARGVLETFAFVPYPVSNVTESTFLSRSEDPLKNGRPMLIPVEITEVLPDGSIKVSGFNQVVQATTDEGHYMLQLEDETEEILITKVLGERCQGITINGVVVNMQRQRDDDTAYKVGDYVSVRVLNVNTAIANRVYINARIEGLIPVEEIGEESYNTTVETAFNNLLDIISEGRVIDASEDITDYDETEDVTGSVSLQQADAATVALLLDTLASSPSIPLGKQYTLLATARIIALMADEVYAARLYGLKMTLLRQLSSFALTGAIPPDEIAKLAEECQSMGDPDLIRRLNILRLVAALDAHDSISPAEFDLFRHDPLVGKLAKAVTAFNLLNGFNLYASRREIRSHIFHMLSLPVPASVSNEASIGISEDLHTEFKSSLVFPANNHMRGDLKKQQLEVAQVVCGMLNTQGGTLFIGVNDNGICTGLNRDFVYFNDGKEDYDGEKILDKFDLAFWTAIHDHIGVTAGRHSLDPDFISLSHETVAGQVIARVTVNPLPTKIALRNGIPYVRQGSSTRPVIGEKERQNFLAGETDR